MSWVITFNIVCLIDIQHHLSEAEEISSFNIHSSFYVVQWWRCHQGVCSGSTIDSRHGVNNRWWSQLVSDSDLSSNCQTALQTWAKKLHLRPCSRYEHKPGLKFSAFVFFGWERLLVKRSHCCVLCFSQEEVFSSVAKNIVESCINGYNGTIFA